jgi:hypothetical protein
MRFGRELSLGDGTKEFGDVFGGYWIGSWRLGKKIGCEEIFWDSYLFIKSTK